MSQLMFWNKQNNNKEKDNSSATTTNTSNGQTNDAKSGKRNWLHAPDALVNGHVVYLVKFFGNLPVEQAKGIEVVKDVIRKLQFAQQMRKAETGTQEKFKKLEITISVDGVAIQEPRTQKILHQFPLHNISYCADEKGVKKFFSFIAKSVKAGDGNGNLNGNGFGSSLSSNGSTTGSMSNETEQHECFVFISNKLASDITLTIGQAFELAYRKYINSAEKTDLGKAQQQIAELEKTVAIYKNRLREVSLKVPKAELDAMLFKMGVKDILDVPNDNAASALTNGSNNMHDSKLLIDTNSNQSTKSSNSTTSSFLPTVPPRNNLASQLHKSNSQKMDELLLNSDSDSDFDPRAEEAVDSSGGGSTGNGRNITNDLFGFEPAKPYGQQLLFNNITGNNNNNSSSNNINSNNNSYNNTTNSDQKLLLNNNNINANNNISSNTNFTTELNLTPPLLAPPPKVAAPRRSISTSNTSSNNNNILSNGNTDLFGSDPFDINGPSIFKPKQTMNIDDFSLESLDPLRK